MQQIDPQLEGMIEVAQPLDEWCEFCTMKLAVGKSADGVPACQDCMKQVLEAMAQYEVEARQVVASHRRGNGSVMSGGAAKARAKRRAKRKRTGR